MMTYGMVTLVLLAATALLWALLRRARLSTTSCAGLCLVFALMAGGSYAMLGNHGVIERERQQAAQADEEERLLKLVNDEPGNVQAMLELGALYQGQEQHARATPLFRQAVVLSNGDPEIISLYGESLVLEAGGKVTEDAKKAFDMALLQDPKQPQGRFFEALYVMQHGEPMKAMQVFKQLRKELPEGHPMKEWLDGMAASVGR
ncbi:hypothetical protein GC177_01825 [bacterium]|nr:hypothetical protein [bacterium]